MNENHVCGAATVAGQLRRKGYRHHLRRTCVPSPGASLRPTAVRAIGTAHEPVWCLLGGGGYEDNQLSAEGEIVVIGCSYGASVRGCHSVVGTLIGHFAAPR